MRSEVTSLSNWAKDRSTLSVSRPIEVVALNCWVTETNDTPCASKSSASLAKSASDRDQAIDLVDNDDQSCGRGYHNTLCHRERRPLRSRPRECAISSLMEVLVEARPL
jgi:hypothetical protein